MQRMGLSSLEDAVRVVALRLACGGPVEAPVREVLGVARGHRLLDDLGLAAHLVEHHTLFNENKLLSTHAACDVMIPSCKTQPYLADVAFQAISPACVQEALRDRQLQTYYRKKLGVIGSSAHQGHTRCTLLVERGRS